MTNVFSKLKKMSNGPIGEKFPLGATNARGETFEDMNTF